MSETEILQRINPALTVLLEAHRYAQASDRDLWDFAVEIDRLRDAGASDSDLRYLVCEGLAEHATEVTRPVWRKRVFRKLHNLAITTKTCFVLTTRGESFAQQARVSEAALSQSNDERDNGEHRDSDRTAVPRWDWVRRQLRVGDLIVKQFRMPAPNQETILAAFEEEGWPIRIDDPLPPLPDLDPKRRLHDAINKLNRNQKQRVLKFRGDGTGRGIYWELGYSAQPDTGHSSKEPERSVG